jgi:hypothetical protein
MVRYEDMTGEQQAEVRRGHRAAKAARAALDAKKGITGVTTTSTGTGPKKGSKTRNFKAGNDDEDQCIQRKGIGWPRSTQHCY